jgi:hypothetical protein
MWGENNILITDENSVEKLKLPGLTMLVEVQVYSYNPKCVCVCVCVCMYVCGGRAELRTYIKFVNNIEL